MKRMICKEYVESYIRNVEIRVGMYWDYFTSRFLQKITLNMLQILCLVQRLTKSMWVLVQS